MDRSFTRIVSWNIRHGGGKRAEQIVAQIAAWKPDIVALSEFRGTEPSQLIARELAGQGLGHQASTVNPNDPSGNRLLLASRIRFEKQSAHGILADTGRWLHVKLDTLHLMIMHVPNRQDGNKYQFHAAVVEELKTFNASPALALGDTNSGEQGLDDEKPFFNKREGGWFQQINAAGWNDVWRQRNPDARAYTWYTAKKVGFRIDQLFATNVITPKIIRVNYDWGERNQTSTISDHAAIVADLEI